MLDHISISVSDPAASKAFYEAALAPLGYRVVMDFGPVTALGAPAPGAPEGTPVPPDLWLTPTKDPTPCHIAVSASSAEQVDAFHRAALAAEEAGTTSRPSSTAPAAGRSRGGRRRAGGAGGGIARPPALRSSSGGIRGEDRSLTGEPYLI